MLDKLIAGALQGMGQQQGGGDMMQIVAGLLSGTGGGGAGGLAGLVQQFQQAGLGEQVSSWISTGQNLPINVDQLMQVFGQGNMQQMAASAGVNVQDFGQQLSQLLPQAVDQMTPSGQLPELGQGGGLEDALASLSKLMQR
jgi:uncharacterized protein YidB (DUF937 family)